ncbi:MAG: phage regulatory CII family protein [Pseudomonadota bacterium]
MVAKRYLKRHAEALVKDVGIERAAAVSGKSKATLGRYYSDADEHAERFMPVDVVAALEQEAGYPVMTEALAELAGVALVQDPERRNSPDQGMNAQVTALSQRFALLMAEYTASIEDGVITVNEARRMLAETLALQRVLADIKLRLESEAASG